MSTIPPAVRRSDPAPPPPEQGPLAPALSMAPILCALVGFGVLLTYGQRRDLFRVWPSEVQATVVGVATFLFAWGLVEIASHGLYRLAERRGGDAGGPAKLGGVAWAGLLLLALGGAVSASARWPEPAAVAAAALLLAGAGVTAAGTRRAADGASSAARPGRAVTQRVALTRPGAACLVISVVLLLGAFLGPSNMLMLVFGLVVGPFIVNGWFSFSMIRRLGLSRSAPPQVMAGEAATVTLSLANRKRRLSGWVMIASDSLVRVSRPGEGERVTAETLFTKVPPRDRRDASYRLRIMRRGRYRFDSVRVRSRFPLGLVERSLTFHLPGELIVAPRLGRLSDRWRQESADEPVQRRQPRRGAFQDEFEKLRSYRHGDNPRSIHWRTSARLGTLMVREYQEIRDRELLVLLDLAADERDEASLAAAEAAVSFAATVCVDHLRRSRQTGLALAVAGRETSLWNDRSAPSAADPLLRTLALAEPARSPDLAEAWAFARDRRSPTTTGLLVTTRPPEAVGRPADLSWLRTLTVAHDLDRYFVLT